MNKGIALPTSFVGRTGHFYILRNEGLSNPTINPKYARYSSVEAYNLRSGTPEYVLATEALTDFSHEQIVYLENLKTTPPDARPEDRDETDLGLTPIRNFWKSQLKQARHAA